VQVTSETTAASIHSSVTFSFWLAVGSWCSNDVLAL